MPRAFSTSRRKATDTIAGRAFTGYIILDPETGAGAYKIGDGANGGLISSDLADYLTILGLGVGVIGLALTSPFLLFLSGAISLFLAVNSFLLFERQIAGTRCEASGALELFAALVIGAAILGFIFSGFAGFAIMSWIGFFAAGAIAGSFLPKKGICEEI